MDWKLIWAQALAYLVSQHGPAILDAIGKLFLAIITSLNPEQQKEIAKAAGVEENIISDIWKTV